MFSSFILPNCSLSSILLCPSSFISTALWWKSFPLFKTSSSFVGKRPSFTQLFLPSDHSTFIKRTPLISRMNLSSTNTLQIYSREKYSSWDSTNSYHALLKFRLNMCHLKLGKAEIKQDGERKRKSLTGILNFFSTFDLRSSLFLTPWV